MQRVFLIFSFEFCNRLVGPTKSTDGVEGDGAIDDEFTLSRITSLRKM